MTIQTLLTIAYLSVGIFYWAHRAHSFMLIFIGVRHGEVPQELHDKVMEALQEIRDFQSPLVALIFCAAVLMLLLGYLLLDALFWPYLLWRKHHENAAGRSEKNP